jgi:dihydroorotate dehydrogenase electron transfer subunit
MPGTYLIWLESPQIASLAQPGQFVMVRCGENTLLRRPLSFHSVVMDRFALLFTVVGRGTQWLSQRQAGDSLDILGPLGNGFSIYPASHNVLLVAGGIGLAPLGFLEATALSQGCSVKLLEGAGTADQLLPAMLLPHAEKVWPAATTLDGSAGEKGPVTILVPPLADWADQVFACGPLPMYKTMAQMAELKDRQVQVSLEVVMGCGHGVCYGCTIRTKQGLKQVCKDGPVFDLNDIIWEEMES